MVIQEDCTSRPIDFVSRGLLDVARGGQAELDEPNAHHDLCDPPAPDKQEHYGGTEAVQGQ